MVKSIEGPGKRHDLANHNGGLTSLPGGFNRLGKAVDFLDDLLLMVTVKSGQVLIADLPDTVHHAGWRLAFQGSE